MRSSSWKGKVALALCSGLSAASKRLAVSVITETVWTWSCIPLALLDAWFWARLFWLAIRPPPTSVADELKNERRLIWHMDSLPWRVSPAGCSASLIINQKADFGARRRSGSRHALKNTSPVTDKLYSEEIADCRRASGSSCCTDLRIGY